MTHPRYIVVVAAILVLLAGTAGAVCQGVEDDCAICAQLGAAAHWSGVASRAIKFTTGQTPYGAGIRFPVAVGGGLCTQHGAFQIPSLDEEGSVPTALVALQTNGTAASFSHVHGRYAYGTVTVYGDIATGGGRVRGIGPNDSFFGAIDTTGTHADVATCRQAIADAQQASDFFAALPPTLTLGTVVVHPGETYTIAAGPGAVVQMDSLTLANAPLGHGYGYGAKICDDAFEPAQLEVTGGGPVILNVARFNAGDCAQYDVPFDLIVNVPGGGGRIRLGVASGAALGGLNILAPRRRLLVTGTGDDTATLVNQFWVANTVMSGFTIVGELGQTLCE